MRWIVAILLLVWAGPLVGQAIPVRSGAHDGFTRLVLDVPAGTTWELQNTVDVASITLIGHSGGFDLSQVFQRIDRSFVGNVDSDRSSLNIAFSCECKAAVYPEGSEMIVIDVSERGPANSTGSSNQSSDFALRFVGARPLRFEPDAARNEDVDELEKQPVQTSLPFPSTADLVEPSEYTGLTNTIVDEARLEQVQENLAVRIGSAATRGILTPKRDRIELPTRQPAPQIDTRIFDSSKPDPEQDIAHSPLGGNVRISSSSDIPIQRRKNFLTSTTLGVRCIDPSAVAVQNWGTGSGFAPQISALRAELFSEFDKLNADKAVQLAQTFLHHGFGAEARQILLLDDSLAEENPALEDLSDIMEFGYVRSSDYLEHFVDCDTDVALWAILASQTIEPSTTINSNAALRALSGLPIHLRSFLAPELSKRLLAYGDEDGAAAALRSLERTAEPLTGSANLAKADLELSQGNVTAAQDRLADIVTSNAEQSAEALIKFVESHLDADAEIDADIATLVEAYAMEMRDDPLGEELRRTHVLALGKSGQFAAAFDALSRVRNRNLTSDQDSLRSSVLELLVKNGDEVEFLQHAFEQVAIAPETLTTEVRFQMAQRLVRIGFAAEADRILNILPDQPKTSRVKILNASIALALSRPQEALAHLYRLDSEEAAELRATATARVGNFENAHTIFSQMGDQENSRRNAWLAPRWSELVEEQAPVFGPMVKIARTDIEVTDDPEGMLGRASSAVAESQRAREVISDLLASGVLGVE